jgi:hypothetical protein
MEQFMNTLSRLLPLVFLLLTGTANAAFMGHYSVNNWTTILDGGTIDTNGAPDSITMTSSDAGSGVASYQMFVNQAAEDSVIHFSWDYFTEDNDGSSFDQFGWFLVDVNDPLSVSFNQLSEETMYADPQDTDSPIINSHQWGDQFFVALAGQVFGFYAQSEDSLLGAATTRIFDFNAEAVAPAAVPVPAALWLIGAPLFGVLSRKRKKPA